MKNFTDYELFKIEEFKDFVIMDMHPIVPEFVIAQYFSIWINFKRPNQPPDTMTRITIDLDTIINDDVLENRKIFKRVFQETLGK